MQNKPPCIGRKMIFVVTIVSLHYVTTLINAKMFFIDLAWILFELAKDFDPFVSNPFVTMQNWAPKM